LIEGTFCNAVKWWKIMGWPATGKRGYHETSQGEKYLGDIERQGTESGSSTGTADDENGFAVAHGSDEESC